jgi:hypothetical protein
MKKQIIIGVEKMEIYSYIDGVEKSIKPNEVALLFNFDELLKFKEFIDFCVEGMRINDEFSHEHFSDFLYYRKYILTDSLPNN